MNSVPPNCSDDLCLLFCLFLLLCLQYLIILKILKESFTKSPARYDNMNIQTEITVFSFYSLVLLFWVVLCMLLQSENNFCLEIGHDGYKKSKSCAHYVWFFCKIFPSICPEFKFLK